MNSNQILILSVFLGYLLFNVVVSFVYSRRAEKSLHTTSEKKYFIGGRNMNGIVLAMTIMATYTSASSFISGPGAAGLTYGYAQAWIAAIQVPVTFLVLGVLGNKLAIVSRRTGAVTVVGYFKARYKSDALVVITSLGLIVFFIAQMISQFTGGATLIASITGMDHVSSLLIFGTVVILYTAIGGFSAVVITDTIQGIVMCIGTFLFIFFVLRSGGGLAAIDAVFRQICRRCTMTFSRNTRQEDCSAIGCLWDLERWDFPRLLCAPWDLRIRRACTERCGSEFSHAAL